MKTKIKIDVLRTHLSALLLGMIIMSVYIIQLPAKKEYELKIKEIDSLEIVIRELRIENGRLEVDEMLKEKTLELE